MNVAVNISGHPVLPHTVSAGPSVSLYGRIWRSYWVEVRDTRAAESPWQFYARVPQTNALQVISGPPKPWQAFRVWEFVADPPILDMVRAGRTNVGVVLYGTPPRNYAVETSPRLDVPAPVWTPWTSTGPMTNSFRIFPAFRPAEARRFYRGKEQ
jgi:hypothetical protein